MSFGPSSPRDLRLRILILEDNPADAKLMLHTLEKAGLSIESDVAPSADRFKRLFESKAYDLILSDYHLPDWTALDAIAWLQQAAHDTPVILVTGTLTDEEAAECFRRGAGDYVLKNKLERLPVAVTHVMEARRLRQARDRAMDKLRESEQQYRLLFDIHPQPMWVYDLDSLEFLEVNRAATEAYGYSREEFLAMTIKEIRPPTEIPGLLKNVVASLPAGFDRAGTWHHRKKDGRIIDVEIISHPVVFAERKAELVLASDVTQLQQGVRALRHSEDRFQKIFQASPEPISISTLADGRYLDVNESFLRVNGFNREEIIGQLSRDIFWASPEERALFVGTLRDSGRVRDLEARFRTKSGEARIGLLSAEIIDLDGERCVLAVTKDITELKSLEKQFLQAQKMEAVGRLASGVAHDFNNLLMIISSSAQMIEERSGDMEATAKYTVQIRDASNRAAGLTRQLLAFSRQQVLQPVVLDINLVISDLFKMLPRLLGEDIKVVFSLAPKPGRISADRTQVEQIIMNLAVNARDAMPEGGTLTIETYDVELAEEDLQAHGVKARSGSYVMLAISDTGIGMDEETKSRIFEPFFSTKEIGKGTGLGLATVYGIVKQSEGWIWVYSEPREGTSFKIYFPRTQASAAVEPILHTPQSFSGTETLLLVEDEAGLRQVTSDYLLSKGYRVLQAEDGLRALQIIDGYKGTIDLLVTDMVMPVMGGPKLVEQTLLKRPQMRVILVSGYTERVMKQSLGEGRTEFLQKPFSLHLLAEKIRTLLDRRDP